ncbi:MAG: S-layer family protein [Cyanobacteriota bacterium]|nr:S-layer family protein [Cyanobacteriota bacterium]
MGKDSAKCSIFLWDGASLSASTTSGEGGNIKLNISDLLILRNGSQISATAGGTGNGGSIDIKAPFIIGVKSENSNITANAFKGNGGNINITTQEIFGLTFRDQLTEESDITASSQFGINGTVKINNIGIDSSYDFAELSAEFTDSSQKVSRECVKKASSSFIVSGKGGIPRSPNQHLISNPIWFDMSDLSTPGESNKNATEITRISNKASIVEATGFIRNSKGEIELVAMEDKPSLTNIQTDCTGYST